MSWEDGDRGNGRIFTDRDGDQLSVVSGCTDQDDRPVLYLGTKGSHGGDEWRGVYVPLDALPELFEELMRASLQVNAKAQEKGL